VVVTVDLEHKITGVNRAVERVFKYQPEEMTARSIAIFLTPESAALSQARVEQALRGEPLPSLFELEGVDQTGKRIPPGRGSCAFGADIESATGLSTPYPRR
jgi:PAS domain S-box-containing protein